MQSSKLHGFQAYYQNSEEYHLLKNEIFTQDNYYFETENPNPIIIDAGAHIGLATLYFKKLYPNSQIIAIEPNKNVINILKNNIYENQFNNVEVIPFALSNKTETINFHQDKSQKQWFSTSGILPQAWNRQQKTEKTIIQAIPLTNLIQQPIDFLKLDIEGSEEKVITATAAKIKLIKEMIIEFHPHPSQSIKRLVEFLQDHKFTVELFQKGKIINHTRIKGLVYIHAY